MTGWGFLALVLAVFVATLLGFAWGAQWQREEQAAQQRFADELAARRRQRGRVPLTIALPDSPSQRRINAMRQHPAGGER